MARPEETAAKAVNEVAKIYNRIRARQGKLSIPDKHNISDWISNCREELDRLKEQLWQRPEEDSTIGSVR